IIAVLLLLLVVCAASDLGWRRIPNWATYSALLWGVLLSALASLNAGDANSELTSVFFPNVGFPVSIGDALAGGLVCFFIMLAVHSTSEGGAGDVKLATAIGALVGVKVGILAICYTFILAGLFGFGFAIWVLGPIFIAKAIGRF